MTAQEIMQLVQSLIWLLAGVGIFIVGMNFMGEALEKSAGSGMKKLLGKISNNRFSGVGIGAGVTAIIQSSSATSVMVIGLVNAGVMTLMQATPIIMGANIGTTITGVLVSLKNDYFNMAMYLLAFVGVMMSFFKKEKVKILANLFCGLGLIFVGLNVMSSEQAFGNALVEDMFIKIFRKVDFPLLLILIGVIFTALIQSSSASTGVVITMVGAGVLPLDLALFIVLGANIGTCVTALLASVGANTNSKRVALIHFTFNVIGTVLFTILIWIFKDYAVKLLVSIFPGNDPMSLQMRVSTFHVIFNVTTTLLLIPFGKQLVKYSCAVIPDKKSPEDNRRLKYVDERLLTTPPVAIMQVKKEVEYMADLAKANLEKSFAANFGVAKEYESEIEERERTINFTNKALTRFLIKLSPLVDNRNEKRIGAYFHVLNDLERIGDHAENFGEIALEMQGKELAFSAVAMEELKTMQDKVLRMFEIAVEVFDDSDASRLAELNALENEVDGLKRELTANHYSRLAEGDCKIELSPYFSSTVAGLERVADHLVNVGYSILNPTGSQSSETKNAEKEEN
ncbi:MAG: Na/Pi cotransporter family protein [Clostridia bacterium]|nr:Na/Pi cotransporter family protein [Clostridia bacterium]